MKQLIIYGMGDFARLMRTLFEQETAREVVGFCADPAFVQNDRFDGLPLCTLAQAESRYPADQVDMFVAAGYSRMRARAEMLAKAQARGFVLANYVSPHAVLAPGVQMGVNNAIFQGVQLEPNVRIGDNNTIWSSVNLCHDVTIGNHVFLAARALVGGFGTVHDLSFIGFNATILQRVSVAEETLVGAGALVLHDTQPHTRYLGVPATAAGTHRQDGIRIP